MSKVDNIVTDTKSELSQSARSELKDIVLKIDKHLSNYFDDISFIKYQNFSNTQKDLYKTIWSHIREHNLRPAKRLRASFVYHGYKLFGGKDDDQILDAAMSIELIHTALLMHDDFMDLDDTRRGKPTTHEFFTKLHKANYKSGDATHYGHSMAVDVGDIALLTGFKILNNSKFDPAIKAKAMDKLLTGSIDTGLGQAYDITLESIGEATEDEILNLHHGKTSIYTYETPLHLGALLAGASDDELKLLSEYAIPGGIAFQLQDDILGIYGDSSKTGKPDYSDIRQGKITLLYTKAVKLADDDQKKLLNKLYANPNLSADQANTVRKIIKDTGSLDYSKKISTNYAQKALKTIPKLRNKNLNKKSIDYLDGIAQYMIERNV